ncbi:hypothetical protein QYE76_068904 [Lolium multiflorum]|uniref:Uncharacterized protein n=1 Tax=Lolium multiflorum TaxID=4521 RepID=A0AAD8SG74_LOLMU|nr:hypothetical protein QYE76_068904 [Lolium multiflorum]
MENYSLLMGAAALMEMAMEMAAVSMEKPSGALPRPAGCRNRDSCPPDLFAMAAALEVPYLFAPVCGSARDGEIWWLTTVYGPTTDALKPMFLDELCLLRAALQGPWAVTVVSSLILDVCDKNNSRVKQLSKGLWDVTGDFNLILDVCDKSNSRLNQRSMAQFHRCINDLDLKEASLIG